MNDIVRNTRVFANPEPFTYQKATQPHNSSGKKIDLFLAPKSIEKSQILTSEELLYSLPSVINLFWLFKQSWKIFPLELTEYIGHLLARLILGRTLSYNFEPTKTLEGHSKKLSAIALNPEGTQALTGSALGTILLWDVASGRQLSEFRGHLGAILSLAFSPQGNMIVSGSKDTTAHVWDISKKRLLHRLTGHSAEITSVVFNAKTTTILTGSWDCTARLWDSKTGKPLCCITTGLELISSVAFGPTGETVVIGSLVGAVSIWDIPSGPQPSYKNDILLLPEENMICPSRGPLSTNGKMILTSAEGSAATLWDSDSCELLMHITAYPRFLCSLQFGPHDTTLFAGLDDGTVGIWDTTTGQCLQRTIEKSTHEVKFLSVNSTGTVILTGDTTSDACLWTNFSFYEVDNWILKKLTILQAWLFINASNAKKKHGGFTLSKESVEDKIFKTMPASVQHYFQKWYCISSQKESDSLYSDYSDYSDSTQLEEEIDLF
ncbi:WD40 repeat domain-containing protein [Candidatus Dependentiae bacterium]|nr:WD40 repeat domain-containing protein [Candidatus Dependentiae bacterium]